MQRFRSTPAAACLVVLLLAAFARADVMQQLPSDALMVVKVNNLKATSDKFGKLVADLGLVQMEPRMKDPLGFLKEEAKMTNGINDAGELAFAFLNPDTSGAPDEDKSVVILIPVTDYQAFLGNWADAKTDGGVSEIKMGDSDEPGFLANWGNYAALSPAREVVANKPATPGIKVPAATAKQLGSRDVILLGNINALRGKALPHLAEGRAEAIKEVKEGMADDPDAAKFAPLVESVMNQAFNAMETFLKDAETATVGMSLNDEGIALTVLADFTADTYLGKTFAGSKNSASDKLVGLPAGKYLLFGGSINDAATANKLIEDLGAPIVKDAVAMGPEFKPVQDYFDALKAYVAANKSGAFGMLAPSGTLGADPIIQIVSVQGGDAKVMLESYKKMMMAQQDVMKAFGIPEDQAKVTITPNARTVDGVNFSSIQSSVAVGDANDPQAKMAADMIKMMYGQEGMTVYMGEVDGQLMTAMGIKDETVGSAITAVRGKASPLAELAGVKSVAANLPKENVGIFYVQVDEIINSALKYAEQFGFKMPIALPPDLPPVGGAVLTEGPALRIDAYVPTPLVQSLVAAGLQAAMQMQGGPGGRM